MAGHPKPSAINLPPTEKDLPGKEPRTCLPVYLP
jgi:hypothetical protein